MNISDSFDTLQARRVVELERLTLNRRYASGDHPLPEGNEHHRDSYKAWQHRSRTNYCGVAASSVAERLRVNGVRSVDVAGADSSWDLWKAAGLGYNAQLVHNAQAELGLAYVVLGASGGGVKITPESPFQVTVDVDPSEPGRIRAASKVWEDPAEGNMFGWAITESAYARFMRSGKSGPWTKTEEGPNPSGIVPVVQFLNRPKLIGGGASEFEDAIDIQDRINSTVLDLMSIAQAQAFRQRWIKGLDLTDDQGNDVDPPFEAVVSALWAVEDQDVQFGEFAQVDLRPLLDLLSSNVGAFVSVTGIPPHYVSGTLLNAGPESFDAAEARLSATVVDRQGVTGEGWRKVLTLAGEIIGTPAPTDIEVVWADAKRQTEAQLADAGLKKAQSGVPWRQRMVDYGYSQDEISRMMLDRKADAAFAIEAAQATAYSTLGIDSATLGIEA
jgi:hypothetical protein